MNDQRTGNTFSCDSSEAVKHYHTAIDLILGSESGAADELDKALALDPTFAMAAAARYLIAKDGNDPKVADFRHNAVTAAEQALPWERAHFEALCGQIEDAYANLQKTQDYLVKHPGDLLVMSQLCGYLIFYGGSEKLSRVVNVLELADPRLHDDWAYQARLGFAVSEAGDHLRGRELAARALEKRPQALYSIHSMAHCLHDLGAADESVEQINRWLENHQETAKGGSMYGHVQWHLALAEWQLGQREEAWSRYARFCAPNTTTCGPVLTLADCGGFILRDYLKSGETRVLSLDAFELTKKFAGMISHPFIALHVAGIHGSAGDLSALTACRESIVASSEGPNRDLSIVLVDAISNFVQSNYSAVIQALAEVSAAQRISVGGSYVERTLIDILENRAKALAA